MVKSIWHKIASVTDNCKQPILLLQGTPAVQCSSGVLASVVNITQGSLKWQMTPASEPMHRQYWQLISNGNTFWCCTVASARLDSCRIFASSARDLARRHA
jgi:hypothetical protein